MQELEKPQQPRNPLETFVLVACLLIAFVILVGYVLYQGYLWLINWWGHLPFVWKVSDVSLLVLVVLVLLFIVGIHFIHWLSFKHRAIHQNFHPPLEVPATGLLTTSGFLWWKKYQYHHPLGLQEHTSTIQAMHPPTPQEKPERVHTFEYTPKLWEVLDEMYEMAKQGKILLGVNSKGVLRWGTWARDICSHLVVGKSRSGKTVTLVMLIIGALFQGYEVWIGDVHGNVEGGLLYVLKPLLKFVARYETNADGVYQMCLDYATMLEAQVSIGKLNKPVLMVIDEFPYTMRMLTRGAKSKQEKQAKKLEGENMASLLLNTVEAYAKLCGYVVLGSHEVTAQSFGSREDGANIRRNFHSHSMHLLDSETANYLYSGRGREVAHLRELVLNLDRGYRLFKGLDGDYEKLYTPFYAPLNMRSNNWRGVELAAMMLEEELEAMNETVIEGTIPKISMPLDTYSTSVNTVTTDKLSGALQQASLTRVLFTGRKKQVLDAFNELVLQGVNPSTRKIAEAIGWNDPTTIGKLLNELEKDGFIERKKAV